MRKDVRQLRKIWVESLVSQADNIEKGNDWLVLEEKGVDIEKLFFSRLSDRLYFLKSSLAEDHPSNSVVCDILNDSVRDLVDYYFSALDTDGPKTKTKCLFRKFKWSNRAVIYATYSPNGKLLAAVSNDGRVGVWDITTGNFIAVGTDLREVQAVAFSPDSKFLAVCYWDTSKADDSMDCGITAVLDISTGKCVRTVEGAYALAVTIDWSTKGLFIAAEGSSEAKYISSTVDDTRVKILDYSERIVATARYSPETKLLAYANSEDLIYVWDEQSGNYRNSLKSDSKRVFSLGWSPDGQFLASGCVGGGVHIWDPITCNKVKTLERHTDTVTSVSYSSDGKFLASSSSDSTIRIWNVQTGECVKTFIRCRPGVFSVQWSPDGNQIVYGGFAPGVYILDVDL